MATAPHTACLGPAYLVGNGVGRRDTGTARLELTHARTTTGAQTVRATLAGFAAGTSAALAARCATLAADDPGGTRADARTSRALETDEPRGTRAGAPAFRAF